MGYLKQLGIFDGEEDGNGKKAAAGEKASAPDAPAAPGITREEFTAAAIRNLAAASEAAQAEDDFVSDPDASSAPEDEAAPPETDSPRTEPDLPPLPTENTADENAPHEEEPETKKNPKRKKTGSFIKRNGRAMRVTAMICGGAVLICLLIYIYGCITAPKDRMGRNIYIENVNVSGMTFDEALAAVRTKQLLTGRSLTVTCAGQQYEINGTDIGLTPRVEDTVDKAMRYGKTTNPLINGLAETLQIFCRHTVAPSANVNEDVLRAKLDEFGKQIYGEKIEHSLEIGDGVVICTPGYTGFDNSTDTAYNEVTSAINGNSDAWLSNIPVTLSAGAPDELTVDAVDSFTYADPQNAYYAVEGGTVVVVPEVAGRYIDRDLAAQLAAQVVEGGEQVLIPFSYSQAEITADVLQAKLFNATIGSYSTSYGTSTANRCANIANAAGRINGKILLPGEIFSFNAAVGPRSTANGFYTAKEYLNGETVDGIGGGTCQVSSTLYNACIYSDLSIISRTSHMFPVGYCPLGQDATVAYGSVDFKFVNSMDYPIKIVAVTSGYTITVSIVGTQRDDPRTVKVVNTVASVGEDTRVTSVREVYNSSGELISKDTLPGSYYKPHD